MSERKQTDLIQELGEMAFASRLKRLNERLTRSRASPAPLERLRYRRRRPSWRQRLKKIRKKKRSNLTSKRFRRR